MLLKEQLFMYIRTLHIPGLFLFARSLTPRGCTDKNRQGMCNVVEREIEEIILALLILALLDNLSNIIVSYTHWKNYARAHRYETIIS